MKSKNRKFQLEASIFNWEIAPGKVIQAWGYNQSLPGAFFVAQQGETIEVHFTNRLPEPTIVHWHGLRIPAEMDGTEEVQKPVMPGETFVYTLNLPDAGTFWFHSHMNETVQMERGLYGALVVRGKNEPVFDNDRVLVLDDMKLNRKHEFSTPSWFLPRWLERHNGREGKVLLINGKENTTLHIHAGQTERWRLINAGSARYIRFSLGGRSFRIIASDGGLIERPVVVDEVLLTPGERVEIAAGPFEEGETFSIASLPYDRGVGKGKLEVYGQVMVAERRESRAVIPEVLNTIPLLAETDAPANRQVVLHGKRSWKDGVDFTINGRQHLHDHPVRVGELQVWEIHNPSMMDHPFHLHGFFFQVLEENGQKPAYRAWKDTVNVLQKGSVKIAWLPDDRPGKWMYHCHILEHHAAGMMAHFEVVGEQTDGSLDQHGCTH